MKQYIDKSKLLEELKKCEKICEDYMLSHKDAVSQGIANAKRAMCQHIIKIINTLETKEVDLETEQRIKDCPFRTVYCERFEGTIVECNGKCSLVVDYPKLKELKAQKGE